MAKEQWVILAAFLIGCVGTTFLGKDFLTTYGILNNYFLNQYTYQAIDGKRLLCHILFERGRAAFTIFLLGRVMPGRFFSLMLKSAVAVTGGFLLTVALINLGIRGILICLCGLLPQWLFYMIALFYYADRRRAVTANWRGNRQMGNFFEYLLQGAILFSSMTLGIITECYVNPIFLAYVLNFF